MNNSMNAVSLQAHVEQVCDLVNQQDADNARTVIGIAGPPASGKSTLAEAVVQEINREAKSPVPRATLLPMDGFHLDNPIFYHTGTEEADSMCEDIYSSQGNYDKNTLSDGFRSGKATNLKKMLMYICSLLREINFF